MVRQQVGLGRFLPLGGPYDGAWIAERAAGGALREAAEREVPEVRLDGVRLGLADPVVYRTPVLPERVRAGEYVVLDDCDAVYLETGVDV